MFFSPCSVNTSYHHSEDYSKTYSHYSILHKLYCQTSIGYDLLILQADVQPINSASLEQPTQLILQLQMYLYTKTFNTIFTYPIQYQ